MWGQGVLLYIVEGHQPSCCPSITFVSFAVGWHALMVDRHILWRCGTQQLTQLDYARAACRARPCVPIYQWHVFSTADPMGTGEYHICGTTLDTLVTNAWLTFQAVDLYLRFFGLFYVPMLLTPSGYPPTAVGYLPTAVGYPPTAVGYPPTAIVGRIGHSEFFFFMATPVSWSLVHSCFIGFCLCEGKGRNRQPIKLKPQLKLNESNELQFCIGRWGEGEGGGGAVSETSCAFLLPVCS